jgi:hypothetical protein
MLFKNDPDGDSDLEPGYRPGVAEEDEKEEY